MHNWNGGVYDGEEGKKRRGESRREGRIAVLFPLRSWKRGDGQTFTFAVIATRLIPAFGFEISVWPPPSDQSIFPSSFVSSFQWIATPHSFQGGWFRATSCWHRRLQRSLFEFPQHATSEAAQWRGKRRMEIDGEVRVCLPFERARENYGYVVSVGERGAK